MARSAHAYLQPLFKPDYLTVKKQLNFYMTISRAIMTFASPSWCTAPEGHIGKLQVFQNRVLRQILDLDRDTRITSLRKVSGIPTIRKFIKK